MDIMTRRNEIRDLAEHRGWQIQEISICGRVTWKITRNSQTAVATFSQTGSISALWLGGDSRTGEPVARDRSRRLNQYLNSHAAQAPGRATRPGPQKIDTELAELHERDACLTDQQRLQLMRLHQVINDMKTRDRQGKTSWQLTDEQAVELANLRLAAYAGNNDPVTSRDGRTAIAMLNLGQLQHAHRETMHRIAELDKIFHADPWSRFFLVTSSNGHIHRWMNCSTCRVTTTFGWLPNLSGLTDAEAVAHPDGGPYLCQVCFPAARPEWCRDRPAPVDPAKVAAQEARAAEKAKKNLTPGQTAHIGRDVHSSEITTVAGAVTALRYAVELANYGAIGERHLCADDAERTAARCREVLLERGYTEEQLDTIVNRKLIAIRRDIRQSALGR